MKAAAIILCAFLARVRTQAPLDNFRPPAVPIITIDPYINVWSPNEHLYDYCTTYWDATTHKSFNGMIRVDNETFTYMGAADNATNTDSTLAQTSVKVWPTRTIYEFQDPPGRIRLTVQFTTPLLPQRWDVASRPVTYVTFTVGSLDGEHHEVQLMYNNNGEIAVDVDSEEVTWDRFNITTADFLADVMEIGTVAQYPFGIRNDDDGINWGKAYVAVVQDESLSTAMANQQTANGAFVQNGTLPSSDDEDKPHAEYYETALIVEWDFEVNKTLGAQKYLVFAYDDLYSIKYFGKQFRPYWRRPSGFADAESLLQSAIYDYQDLLQSCEEFDNGLVQDLELKGGEKYATLAALAYRQTMAATKLVWNDDLQTAWAFLKSISTSSEDMSPLDTITAASSLFLYTDPSYLQAMLLPILTYANNETGSSDYDYPFPWAPHYLGTYPTADVYGGSQDNMPMEDTGNLLILLSALTRLLGSESTSVWYPKYWPLLQSWVDYLITTLPDPGDQTNTDTFLPPTPHDANLAIKGIVGLGAYAQLCSAVGKGHERRYYNDLAESFAQQWIDLALEDDHYKLAFDQNGTWSLKYNLFYDKLLALGMFPAEVVSQEIDYYMKYHLNTFGIPLDNRVTYTKLDWMAYAAATTDSTVQQQDIFTVLYNWAMITTPLTPLTDWYDVMSGNRQGYTARPVVGALYSLMLV